MSTILEKIADDLAQTALRLEEELNDLDVVERIAKQIGTASPTVEEAFRTAVRMRRAEAGARRFMAQLGAKAGARPQAPSANLPARRDVTDGKS